MDDSQIRERAYQIWENEGHPNGFALEHWVRAEQEVLAGTNGREANRLDSSDQEGIQAAKKYEESLKQFESKGEVEAKAREAERALEGPESETLRAAEKIGKKRGRGEDLAGNR